LTNIWNHFYFILVANTNFSHSFSFSQQKYVVLILVVVLFQISQLFMDIYFLMYYVKCKQVHKSAASNNY